ncbi:hypothetical protein EV646_116141 [Kribbella antiqua]|uniref:Lipoprotein n=1 Tax=Kribbella antiqua TaxID=2512217 RepID=A0A4R2IBF6_9ACTN|nr:hypothetical protein [Kribbella antiqua]TCO41049.1 hypothetical protein EV646_116141 [Kribbella antiqua]
MTRTKIRKTGAATTLAVAAIGSIALLTGCGGNETPAGGSPSNQGTTAGMPSSTRPSASASESKTAPDAATIAKALQAASGGHIKSLWTYTEDTDPNNLIGRPGGYTSATFAYDNRVPDCKAKPDSMCGAQVEQFANEADAKRRLDYIAGIYKAAPILGTEYLTVEGSTLLRVTGELKPSVNRAYVAAFNAALSK